jgi:hypothetical protein
MILLQTLLNNKNLVHDRLTGVPFSRTLLKNMPGVLQRASLFWKVSSLQTECLYLRDLVESLAVGSSLFPVEERSELKKGISLLLLLLLQPTV